MKLLANIKTRKSLLLDSSHGIVFMFFLLFLLLLSTFPYYHSLATFEITVLLIPKVCHVGDRTGATLVFARE